MDYIEQRQRKIHPREKNSKLSNLFFLYTLSLLRKGLKRDLSESDLYTVLPDYKSEKLGDQLEKEWINQKKYGKNWAIIRTLVKCFGPSYLTIGILQLIMDVADITIQPYMLGKFVSYFSKDQSAITRKYAIVYGVLLIGFFFLQRVYKHNYMFALTGLGIKLRTAFSSFMYRKALKLSPIHLCDICVGKFVTLITKDVEAFGAFIDYGNDIWVHFIRTAVVTYFLYRRIGTASLVAVGFFSIILPLQIFLGMKLTSLKLKMCQKTDKRLQITQETLSAIKIIKLYTWEKYFEDKISSARRNEIFIIYKIFFLKFFILAIGSLSTYIALYILLTTYIRFGNVVTAEIVYFIFSSFGGLAGGLTTFLPIGINQAAELMSAIKRIEKILTSSELQPQDLANQTAITTPKIVLENITISIKNKEILKNINLVVEKGLTLLTGPVGSGKSLLLKTVLKEYVPEEGKLNVEGTISYASQEPWLFPSSIKQNILFGEKYNERRYQEVLRVCALIYDLQLLQKGDCTIIEDRGINLSKGQQVRINLARAVYKETDIYLLDHSLAALDTHVSSYIFQECIKQFLRDKVVILVAYNTNYIRRCDSVIYMQNGNIQRHTKTSEEDISVTKDINDEHYHKDKFNNHNHLTAETERKVFQEHKESGGVDCEVYKKYIKSGGFVFCTMVFGIFVLTQLSESYTDKLISNWVNIEEKFYNYSTANVTNSTFDGELEEERATVLYWYNAMAIVTTVATLGKAFAIVLFARQASLRIHKKMITTLINSVMQFFDKNFIGNILNRFSKDLTTVDETIPSVMYHLFGVFLSLVGIITLISSVDLMFLISSIIFFIILVILRQCCVQSTRTMKRLDAVTKSPVVGYMNATVEGLTTIRALKAENVLKKEFDHHQDLYASASYIYQSSMRAFGFALDNLCGFFIASVILKFLFQENDNLAGDVGLVVTQAYGLSGSLEWGIRQWAEIENQMTSVERVLEYTEIPTENKKGTVVENWPGPGEVRFENVSLYYTNPRETVLKNINFTVKPQEKIGIVGRTGSGKTSIISTLFRLYDVKGKITIDGVDVKTLPLHILRSKIAIIPQDPVLFSGTFQDNIDPTGIYTDEDIWKAVERANLRNLISNLNLEIVEGGSHFSIGQRQLICLARALIQQNKIIVLDEATSSMDAETDALILQTIHENFGKCTVFTIAHKLHSVLNCSKIMVVDKGEIIEFDKPTILLENKESAFYNMVAKAGILQEDK